MNQIRTPHRNEELPTTFLDLSEAERLIVGAHRHWFTGVYHERGLHFSVVAREFRLALGDAAGGEAFTAFAAVTRVLQRSAPEAIRFHLPCCKALGASEVQLICLVAASQQGRFLLSRDLAGLMVEADAVGDLLGRVSDLASVLNDARCRLPQRIGALHAEKMAESGVGLSIVH